MSSVPSALMRPTGLYRDTQIVPLPPKVVDTLLVLVENVGSVVDKETLLSRVWPDTFVDENNLAQNISVLRLALRNGDSAIETIPQTRHFKNTRKKAPEIVSDLKSGHPAGSRK